MEHDCCGVRGDSQPRDHYFVGAGHEAERRSERGTLSHQPRNFRGAGRIRYGGVRARNQHVSGNVRHRRLLVMGRPGRDLYPGVGHFRGKKCGGGKGGEECATAVKLGKTETEKKYAEPGASGYAAKTTIIEMRCRVGGLEKNSSRFVRIDPSPSPPCLSKAKVTNFETSHLLLLYHFIKNLCQNISAATFRE